MSDITVDIESLYTQMIDEDQKREATAFPTVRSGVYRFQAAPPITPEIAPATDAKGNATRFPGRPEFRVRFALTDKETGEKRGSVFATLSPQNSHFTTKNGQKRQDRASQLWGQIAKAFDTSTVGETVKALEQYPLDGYVEEYFKTLSGEYITPKTPAERDELIEKGATAGNSVRNVGRVK